MPQPGQAQGWYAAIRALVTEMLNELGITTAGSFSGANVVGAASSTLNAIARFGDTTGKTLKNSAITIDDNGAMSLPAGQALTASGGLKLTEDGDAAISSSGDDIILRADGADRVTLSDASLLSTVPLQAPNGTGAAPSVHGGDATSGMAFAAGQVLLAAAGATKVTLSATELVLASIPLYGQYLSFAGKGNDFSPGVAESGRWFANSGAAAQVIANLPVAATGIWFGFVVTNAFHFQIKAQGGDVIRGDQMVGGSGAPSSSAVNGFWRCNEVGAHIVVVAIGVGVWQVTQLGGQWGIDG